MSDSLESGMTTQVQSAWPDHPDYQIDVAPSPYRIRIWHDDVLLADSEACLLVTETDHVDRLYCPEADVRWDLLEPSDHLTECPFKGRASYWKFKDVAAASGSTDMVAWTYRDPLPEVAQIAGYVSFLHETVRIEVVESWADGSSVAASWPLWGDAGDLTNLMDVERFDNNRFLGHAHGPTRRDVVEGGQLLGAAIVAVSKTIPDQRVTAASMIFTKAASFDSPVDLAVDVLRRGKTFSTTEARISQNDRLCSVGLVLSDVGSADIIRDQALMPDVPGPEAAQPFPGFGTTGREIRVVDGAYDQDPDRIGPPKIDVWVRFRDSPAEPYLNLALLAQSTTHWTIAAGLAPHRGVGEAQAHATLSTGIMKSSIAFHDDVDVSDWLLYSNDAFWSGRGLIQGSGRVFTQDGRLAASYSVQAMARAFGRLPADMGRDSRTAL